MATTGHESEVINVGGLKASLQKLKTDIIDGKYEKPGTGIPASDLADGVIPSAATTTADGLMSSEDKTKLNGIETGAQVHIAPTNTEVINAIGYTPYNATNPEGYTSNTGTVTGVTVGTQAYTPSSGVVTIPAYPTTLPASDVEAWAKAAQKPSYNLDEVTDGTTRKLSDYQLKLAKKGSATKPIYVSAAGTIAECNAYPTTLPASDVSAWAKAETKPSYTKSEVGLSNVTNDAQVKRTEMGVANGVATLDANGLVPSTQLPSYVDDVIDGYLYNGVFYKESTHQTAITGETGKIYVNLHNDKSYRWSGSAYTEISSSDVTGIKVGSSGSTITPSQGVITIPAYETNADVTDADNVKAALGTNATHNDKYLRKDGTWQDAYVANLKATSAASYISEPEVKSVKINGSTTNAASSSNCVLQYDTTNACLKFIFN